MVASRAPEGFSSLGCAPIEQNALAEASMSFSSCRGSCQYEIHLSSSDSCPRSSSCFRAPGVGRISVTSAAASAAITGPAAISIAAFSRLEPSWLTATILGPLPGPVWSSLAGRLTPPFCQPSTLAGGFRRGGVPSFWVTVLLLLLLLLSTIGLENSLIEFVTFWWSPSGVAFPPSRPPRSVNVCPTFKITSSSRGERWGASAWRSCLPACFDPTVTAGGSWRMINHSVSGEKGEEKTDRSLPRRSNEQSAVINQPPTTAAAGPAVRSSSKSMQLMTFNSLLMFDIVFIFFLFLVCVTCLVYYLPPRELSPAHPPLAEEDEHCHDHCHHYHHHLHHACCDEASTPVLRVRECAAAARRISGGGTPTGSLPDLSAAGILSVPKHGDADVGDSGVNHDVPEVQPARCYPENNDSSGNSQDVPASERQERALWQHRLGVASPSSTPHHRSAPYRSPFQEFPRLHQSYFHHLHHQGREAMDGGQPQADHGADVFPLDCALTDMFALCPRTSVTNCANLHGLVPTGLPPSPAGTDHPNASLDGGSGSRQFLPNPCNGCIYPTYTGYCHAPLGANDHSSRHRQQTPPPRPPSPPPAVVNYRTAGRHPEEHVQFVQIQIERQGNIGGGSRRGSDGNEASVETPLPLPACCYVRAKTSDIKECSGPIHDVLSLQP
uniref:Uncharacterized protein n=1 Tax=Anopheles atroparvus TaxID=41427 RepID=A0A182JDH0_ANOAO